MSTISAITEKVELLGKGLYTNIPDTLTLRTLTTLSELDYVGSEDFDKVMVEKILPEAIVEDIDVYELLEIDYQWLLRALRILSYGPYYTTNAIFCDSCGKTSQGEYRVNLNNVLSKPIPENFINDIIVRKSDFIEFDEDIHLSLMRVKGMLGYQKDKLFEKSDGTIDRVMARLCYMIKSIGSNDGLTPVDVKLILNKMHPADLRLLRYMVNELSDFGLRAGGITTCPACGSKDAGFIAIADDRFFRPTLGDLQQWRDDRNTRRKNNDVSRDASKNVRNNS